MPGSDSARYVLASASPRRRELLSTLGIPFSVEPSGADETLAARLPPEEAACDLASRKAAAVAVRTELPVLAADTLVVAADGRILGKPASASEAETMLRQLSGTTHRVVTGVALVPRRRAAGTRTRAATTLVTMRALTDGEIRAYAASGEPFGKAGGYAIQEEAEEFVVRLEGSRTNVVGLPLEVVTPLLREEGLLA